MTSNNAQDVLQDGPPAGVIAWSQVKEYLRCPQRVWYQAHAGLSERGDRSYPRFHKALYSFLSDVAAAARRAELPSVAALQSELDARYDAAGLGVVGHGAVLRQSGHVAAGHFIARLGSFPEGRWIAVRPWILLPVGDATIGFRPSEVEYEGEVARVARVHFFKPRSEGHHERPDVAFLYLALGMTVHVELWYPLDDSAMLTCQLEERRPEAIAAARSRKDNLEKYLGKKLVPVAEAVAALQAGQFYPILDEQVCSGCGYQYACPGIT